MSGNRLLRLFIVFATLTMALSSCEKVDLSEFEDSKPSNNYGTADKTLKVVTRSGESSTTLQYPISVYVFNENGALVTSTTVDSNDDDKGTVKLPEGKFRVAAVYTPSTYPSIPTMRSSGDGISMPSDGYAKQPMMMGMANVNMVASSQTANIVMAYPQASLTMILSAIPEDVTAVSVTIGSPYSKIDMGGNLSGETTVTIPCTKSGNNWTTGTVYILPTKGTQTVITVTLNMGNNSSASYSYTYMSNLQGATPYYFSGTYTGNVAEGQDEFDMSATITSGQWNETISSSFDFGPGSSHGGSAGGDNVSDSAIPSECSIWNNHVVALVENNTGTEADIMLISRTEEEGVHSALNSTNYDEAQNIADEYSENGLGGWSIPTREEATKLRNKYGYSNEGTDPLASLNQCLASKGVAIVPKKSTTNVRYLCEEATYTYAFVQGASFNQAGASNSTTYHLRLVKWVHVTKE